VQAAFLEPKGEPSAGTAVAKWRRMADVLGWLSSVVLLSTLTQQIWTQWRERSTRGVSKWLFVGQTAASVGFTIYSWMVGNWVFVVTNALILVSAIVGALLNYRFRSRPSTAPAASEPRPELSAS
jgi:uncharacterized protein with PQ loop repeat